jgi:hypothetical protein
MEAAYEREALYEQGAFQSCRFQACNQSLYLGSGGLQVFVLPHVSCQPV